MDRAAMIAVISKAYYDGISAGARADADARAEKAVDDLQRLGYVKFGPRESFAALLWGHTTDA